MARPRKDTPEDCFTSTEVAIAADMTPRNFGLLLDRGYAPSSDEDEPGTAGARLFGAKAFSRASMIGAMAKSGFDLLLAAKLTDKIATRIEMMHPCLPSHLFSIWHHVGKPKINLSYREGESDYWIHKSISTTEEYIRSYAGKSYKGDYIVEIVNGEYVLSRTTHGLGHNDPVFGIKKELPECRIREMERGGNVDVIDHEDELDGFDFYSNPADREKYRVVVKPYYDAYDNYASMISINVSLVVRNSYDRLRSHRDKK